MTAQSVTQPELDSSGRLIFSGIEHGEIEVPASYLFSSGSLDVYPEIARGGLFRVYSKQSRIVFQAAGSIGLIPINDKVAIYVETRVPVSNLEEILFKANGFSPKVVNFLRTYQVGRNSSPFLIDSLSESLLGAISQAQRNGFHREFEQTRSEGAPRGRLLPFESSLLRAKTGRPSAVSQYFERRLDNYVNRCLRSCLERLLSHYESTTVDKRQRRLNQLREAFFAIPLVPHASTKDLDAVATALQQRHGGLEREDLLVILSICHIVLSESGLQFASREGSRRLGSLLIAMDDVFERYVRELLKEGEFGGLVVLDGNLNPPMGGAAHVFDGVTADNPRATPDIVLRDPTGRNALIVEVKYKPTPKIPDRADLNQALVYTLTHKTDHALLAYPSMTGATALRKLGHIEEKYLWLLELDLASTDMGGMEVTARGLVSGLLASGS